MITYKEKFNSNREIISATVLLDGKVIGEIKRINETFSQVSDYGVISSDHISYQYQPTGCSKKFSGEKFSTIHSCKRSLEEE